MITLSKVNALHNSSLISLGGFVKAWREIKHIYRNVKFPIRAGIGLQRWNCFPRGGIALDTRRVLLRGRP